MGVITCPCSHLVVTMLVKGVQVSNLLIRRMLNMIIAASTMFNAFGSKAMQSLRKIDIRNVRMDLKTIHNNNLSLIHES